MDARIYSKSKEILSSGAEYWKEIWGEVYAISFKRYSRVEFEVLRGALREFMRWLDDPDDVLYATRALWSYLTEVVVVSHSYR